MVIRFIKEEISMKADLAVPGSVSPIERIIDIKNQQIQDIVEYNEQKKSPFRKWVQMNYDDNAYQADDFLVANSPTAYRIFKFLIANMDRYNAVIVSYKVLQQVFGYGQATVARAIKFLKDHNYIEVVRTGGANVYTVNKHLYRVRRQSYHHCLRAGQGDASQNSYSDKEKAGSDSIPAVFPRTNSTGSTAG